MGSLCCVAARPHGSSVGSQEWSLGRNEPFWQTNSSFSPPLSRRWDHYGSHVDSGVVLYGSSLSSSSKGSRSLVGGEHLDGHQYSASDGAISSFSSPSESYQNQELMPPTVQGVNMDNYVKESASGPLTFSWSSEGNLGMPCSVGCLSSRSDGSEYEATSKSHSQSLRNISNRCSFMSKPVHPFVFPEDSLEGDDAHGSFDTSNSNNSQCSYLKSIREPKELQSPWYVDLGGTSQRETAQWSSASSIDPMDSSEPLEAECLDLPYNNASENLKCGLCERLLSQRSPWGSRRIFRSGDMPIAGVLSCWHVYHAECLEHATPKTQKHDPPCPLCEKSEESVPEPWAICRLRNGLHRLRSLGGEGSSSIWSCGQVGDCVERALRGPKSSSMSLINQNRLKRHLSIKENSGKELAEKSKTSGLASSQLFDGRILGDRGSVVCSKLEMSPALKRW